MGWEIYDGRGIPPELLPTLFDPSVRSVADETGHRGFGLGLATAQVLAEATGGVLVLQPVRPRGAWFRLQLPDAGRGLG